MADDRYDVIIVGASFAGLAAASQLTGAGRVLIVDHQPIGAGETSACGTPLAVLERLDALDAVEQVHHRIMFTVADQQIIVPAGFPFATFDYHIFCRLLAGRLGGTEIAIESFAGLDPDGTLRIGARRVRGRILVDASGWRARLATALGAPAPEPGQLGFGLEVRCEPGGQDLQFWIRPPEARDGVLWSFPAGEHTRDGIGSYRGRSKGLGPILSQWRRSASTAGERMHGGHWTSRLRDPVIGPAFLAGDAAGHCLPTTAEGIRPALVWGQEAGRQAARVLAGQATLPAAQQGYRRQILAHRRFYRELEWLQATILCLPLGSLPWLIRALGRGPASARGWRVYWQVADPDRLRLGRHGCSPAWH